MTDGKLRVVTDEAGRGWVQAADVPEVAKLGLKALRKLCPEVAHFELEGRPVRWLPVDGLGVVLVAKGMAPAVAATMQAACETAPLTAAGLRRHGLGRAVGPVGEMALPAALVPVDAQPVPVASQAEPVVLEATLVPRAVDGWTLFDGGGGTWVKDLDIAERAGLALPRDIRRTVAKAIEDGALMPVGAAHGDGSPCFRQVDEVVTGGKGSAQTVPTYYLNLEGALLLLTRLRTPKAIEVTKAVVVVFAKAMRGELPMVAPTLAADPRLDRILGAVESQGRSVDALLGILATLVQRFALPAASPPVPAPPVATAASPSPLAALPPPPPPTMLIPRDWRSAEVIAALLTERRGHRVPRSKVDAAVTALKLRERPEVARHGLAPRTDGGGVHYKVPFWRYAPEVVDEVERHLFAKPAAQTTIPVDSH